MTPQPPEPSGSKIDQALSELGDYQARYRELADTPDVLVASMREDTEFAAAFCRADTITYLRQWFTRRQGWTFDRERSGPAGPAGILVEWAYEGVHDGASDFNGLAATGRPVIVRGVTIAGVGEGGKFKLRRYVDWAGLFAQLGLTLNWRVPVPSGPPAGRADAAS